jgi:hypothetical protein
MANVKRYWFDVRRNEQEIPGMRGYVESEDYDALLAVLRRCVEAMEDANNTVILPEWGDAYPPLDAALAAARPYLERKEGEK